MTIKNILKISLFPIIFIRDKIFICIGKHNPILMAKIYCTWNLRKKLNLDNPKDLNEKINWLKFNSDTSIWSDLADKYKVREYVRECGLEHILVKLYGAWKKSEDIDFDKLPNSFVIKTNNYAGTVILIKDKNKLDIESTRRKLNDWLKFNDGIFISVELHYSKINPLIIAEEFLKNDAPNISSSLIDYKFWCLNGEPFCVLVCYDRKIGKHVPLVLYDLDWNNIGYNLTEAHRNNKSIPKPASIKEMIDICRILSKPFPQVRIDLYEVNGHPVFGEMTFTAYGGFMNYFTSEFLIEMGNKVDLRYLTRN